jgi:hypothetical protein
MSIERKKGKKEILRLRLEQRYSEILCHPERSEGSLF